MSDKPSPVPLSARNLVRIYAPDLHVRYVAGQIAELSWIGDGVHVYRWACGTVAIAKIDSLGDSILQRRCLHRFVGAWRDARLPHVLDTMRWLAGGEA